MKVLAAACADDALCAANMIELIGPGKAKSTLGQIIQVRHR